MNPVWVMKLGEGTTSDDHLEMIKNHELDDIVPEAEKIVDAFLERFPGHEIDQVTLVINKKEPVEMIKKIRMVKSDGRR